MLQVSQSSNFFIFLNIYGIPKWEYWRFLIFEENKSYHVFCLHWHSFILAEKSNSIYIYFIVKLKHSLFEKSNIQNMKYWYTIVLYKHFSYWKYWNAAFHLNLQNVLNQQINVNIVQCINKIKLLYSVFNKCVQRKCICILFISIYMYCKCGYFPWEKISWKCWQELSCGVNFHDTSPFSVIVI